MLLRNVGWWYSGFIGWFKKIFNIIPLIIIILIIPSRLNSFTWHKVCIDSVVGSGAYGTDIEVDSLGYPHIIYKQVYDKGLMYARWNGNKWLYEDVSESLSVKERGTAGEISLELDSLGYPHISQPGPRYTWKDSYGWHREFPDPGAHEIDWTSLRLDSEGRPHIAYNDYYEIGPDEYTGVRYCFKDSGQWKVNVVVYPNSNIVSVGEHGVSLALDSLDLPHIIYSWGDDTDDWFRTIGYAYKDTSGSWYKELFDTSSVWAHYPNLELDSLGRPVVAYGFGAADFDLRVARRNYGIWNCEYIDTVKDCGIDNGLFVDDSNDTYIVYWASDNWMKFAYNRDSIWKKEKIDLVTSGDGSHLATSFGIVKDNSGYLHISYTRSIGGYDNNRMWYATTNPETGVEEKPIQDEKIFSVPSVIFGNNLEIICNTSKYYRIEIYDITGRKIKDLDTLKSGNKLTINISGIKGGIYFILFKSEGIREIKKITVVR